MEENNLLVIERKNGFEKTEFEIVKSDFKKESEKTEDKEKSELQKEKVEDKESEGKDKKTKQRTKCEVYSRVVGYLRPVGQWNEGKQAEWDDRTVFVVQ